MAILDTISSSVLVASMAGGPITEQLIVAAEGAGSLASLAVGTSTVEQAQHSLERVIASGARYGFNLFYPQPPLQAPQVESTGPSAALLNSLDWGKTKDIDFSFGWQAKLDLALGARDEHGCPCPPLMVWTMFGCPSQAEVERIHAAGVEVWVTVTTEAEALEAAGRGADVLCVQGPEAGGHRGVWDCCAEPDERSLKDLVGAVHAALEAAGWGHIPLLAAGGLRTAADVSEALSWPGVVKACCGSAFLLADEAGTSARNRETIAQAPPTVSSRAFSGRYARGVETNFTRANPHLPPLYPLLNLELKERRAAGDQDVSYCLVGIRTVDISGGSVAEILSSLHK